MLFASYRIVPACLAVLALADTASAQTQFRAELDGTQTVPPSATTATGTCTGTLNAAETEFTFSCSHGVTNALAGHLHRGAPGASGEVVFAISETGCCPDRSTWFPTPQEAADLRAGRLYVNIHAGQFTTESIRGQFLPEGGIGTETGGAAPSGGVCGSSGAAALLLTFCALWPARMGRVR